MSPFRIVCLVLIVVAVLFVVVLFLGGNGEEAALPSWSEVTPPSWTYSIQSAFASVSPTIELQKTPLVVPPGETWDKLVPPGSSPVRILKFCLKSNSRLNAVYTARTAGAADQELMNALSGDDGCQDGKCQTELPRAERQGPRDDPRCGSFIIVSGGGTLQLRCTGMNSCRIEFE